MCARGKYIYNTRLWVVNMKIDYQVDITDDREINPMIEADHARLKVVFAAASSSPKLPLFKHMSLKMPSSF